MAIMHFDVDTVSRSAGRSAVAAAAYRAAARLRDERTGQVFDYRPRARSGAVAEAFVAVPANAPAWASDRQSLWSAVEAAETRCNSVVAREWMVALPAELDAATRAQLVRDLAAELVKRYGVAVDAAIHTPPRGGDIRNHHAHVLASPRVLTPAGFGAKTRILDAAKTGGPEIKKMRYWWADLVNAALEAAGRPERIDPRTKAEQAAAAAAAAREAEQEAEALAALAKPMREVTGLGEVLKSMRAVARNPSAMVGDTGATLAAQKRAEAVKHRERARRFSYPVQSHKGPVKIATRRRKASGERWKQDPQYTWDWIDEVTRVKVGLGKQHLDAIRAESEREYAKYRAEARARTPSELKQLEEDRRVLEAAAQREHAARIERERREVEARRQRERREADAAEEVRRQRDLVEKVEAAWLKAAEDFPVPGKPGAREFRFGAPVVRETLERTGAPADEDTVWKIVRRVAEHWVQRIAAALPALDLTERNIWKALAGGSESGGRTLKALAQELGNLVAPLRSAFLAHTEREWHEEQRARERRWQADAGPSDDPPQPRKPSPDGP